MNALIRYQWPGNVRELKNVLERLVIMTSSGVIGVEDLPHYISGAEPGTGKDFFRGTLKEARRDFEKEFIIRKLDEVGGNISKAAEAIGVERSHLYRKIKSYGIRT